MLKIRLRRSLARLQRSPTELQRSFTRLRCSFSNSAYPLSFDCCSPRIGLPKEPKKYNKPLKSRYIKDSNKKGHPVSPVRLAKPDVLLMMNF